MVEDNMNTMWYKSPAKDWNEALPVGNGRMGGMVFGRTGHEIIQLNEESIWSGPYRDRNNRSSLPNLPKIRELLNSGHPQEAQELAFECMTGCPSQESVYQTAGELHVDFYNEENRGLEGPLPDRKGVFDGCIDYRRELDLENGIATTSFCAETKASSTAFFSKNSHGSSITYTREVFVSAVDDVLAFHVTASTPKSIYLRAYLDRGDLAGKSYALQDDTLVLQSSGGIPFCAMVMASVSRGKVFTRGNFLIVEAADEVTLYVDIESAFRSGRYRRSGGNIGSVKSLLGSCTDRALKKLCFAAGGTYENQKKLHAEDFSSLYKRISLSLSENAGSVESAKSNDSIDSIDSSDSSDSFESAGKKNIPTDELLSKHAESPYLAELYWNFDRYLLLSCSRKPGTLPATLQGLWNKDFLPPWGSKYTVNINTEMNYWPASMCSMGETEMPLFNLLKRAYKHGKKTARVMYGADGYVIHHNLDIWGDTAPQDMWIPGTYWVLGAAWLATHIREHYEYTLDRKFLKKHFKLMRRACDFFADYLVPSSDGKHLVVSPSVSPENTYRLPSGETGSFSAGCDMDNRILEHLFRATIQSALDLGKSEASTDVVRWQNVLSKIEEPVITKEGTIREWPMECEETEPGHRHISQLYGLFPGHSINLYRTPDLAKAAKATIEKRLSNGGGHTGWSQAWIMNFRASLHDKNEAFKSLVSLFKKSTLPNLFDNHPPFQIDGNFGSLAAMTRMIVQSEIVDGKVIVDLFPALPDAWRKGELKGVCIKGNLRMNLSWEDGRLKSALLFADSGTNYIENVGLYFQGKYYKAPLLDGKLEIKNILPTTM